MSLPAGWAAAEAGETYESGQAWVYVVVRSTEPDRRFALKRLKNVRRRDRFKREVNTMQRLRGSGILTIPEVIEADLDAERPWFVMRWFELGSLERAIDDQRFLTSPEGGLDVLRALAQALRDVHAAGVAHRDLKPANVLLDDLGDLALSDFGLCLEVDPSEARLTAHEEAVGSRLYIAPENEGGMNDSLDQRPADFYSFGKLSWAVLAGRQPLPREQILDGAYRLETIANDTRLRPLDWLLHDLLNRDPRGRLADWSTVLRELISASNAICGATEVLPRPPHEDAVAAARRLRTSSVVVEATEQELETRRRRGWLEELRKTSMDAARVVDRALAPIVRELGEVLGMTVSTGATALATMVQRYGAELPSDVLTYPLQDSDDNLVTFIIHSAKAISGLPTLVVPVWLTGKGSELWLTRLPIMSVGFEEQFVPIFLLQHIQATRGPWTILRQATVDQAAAFVDETGRLFITLAEQYLAIVDAGGTPADAATWEGRNLVPQTSSPEASAGSGVNS